MWLLFLVLQLVLFFALMYLGLAFWAWVAPLVLWLSTWALSGIESPIWFGLCTALVAGAAIVTGVRPIRRRLITRHIEPLVVPLLPRMSATEKEALEAGTVWWDAQLFSGRPDWKQLLDYKQSELSPRERAFLDNQVDKACAMVSDWEVHKRNDLPQEVWQFLAREKFFGMIIPEEHGGLGFSAQAQSAVVTKLSSRSATLAVTVMVPNSLGPAELILHYGTPAQQRDYLPRLARGEEIPCFALTEPFAGSDAGSIRATGVVCRGEFEGQEVLGMRLNWDKRYCTLAPVATVIGLAFQLRDPDNLLGRGEDLGITCALIPARLPGVETGARHDPLGVPFLNGTTVGHDVFVPLDFVIGGPEKAGKGWGMLMQCLAAGRGISLPAMSTGAAQLTTRVVGAYATVREQFGLPVGRFEGIEEPIARIAGTTYLMDSARRLTASAIDGGEKPSVVSAIVKRYLTEAMRNVINDGMDVVAGAAISRGPRNVLAGAYEAAPIGITVEGANILTRSMIIFGQGAIRCHPHAQAEMRAAESRDHKAFDRAFFAHIGFLCSNAIRAWLLGVSSSRLAMPPVGGHPGRYLSELSRLSAAFAFVADVAMGTLGGSLKRKEKLSGRLADVLGWMYLASATVKRFVGEGMPGRDLPYMRWACEHAIAQAHDALAGFLANFPLRSVALAVRAVVFPFGARRRAPSDWLGAEVARGILEDGEARRALTQAAFVPGPSDPALGRLEDALHKVVAARPAQQKVRDAVKAGKLPRASGAVLLDAALAAGVVTKEEVELIAIAERARAEAIAVDAFGGPRDGAGERSHSPAISAC